MGIMRRMLVVSTCAVLLLAACGSSSKKSESPGPTTTAAASATSRPVVDVDAKDFTFEMPDTIPSGWVDIALHNRGAQEHQIAFVKLGSMTFEHLKARAASTDLNNIPSGTVFAGGPNAAGPGQTVTATVHLDAGTYAVFCVIPDFAGDQKPHAVHGMIKQITVAPTAETVERAPVADGGTIQLSEFTFVVPAGFKGQGTVKVDNVGNQVHELIIYKIAPGKTFDDVKNFVVGAAGGKPPAGPPPFEDAGGIVGAGAHQVNYQKMALTPGKYALLCFFPDTSAKNGLPHALKGMAKELDIS